MAFPVFFRNLEGSQWGFVATLVTTSSEHRGRHGIRVDQFAALSDLYQLVLNIDSKNVWLHEHMPYYSAEGDRGRSGLEQGGGLVRSEAFASNPNLPRRARSFSTAGLAAVRSLSP